MTTTDQVSAAMEVLQLVATDFEEERLAMFGRHLSGKLTRPPEGVVIGSGALSYEFQLTAMNN